MSINTKRPVSVRKAWAGESMQRFINEAVDLAKRQKVEQVAAVAHRCIYPKCSKSCVMCNEAVPE